MDINKSEIEQYTRFVEYAFNVDSNEFSKKFYGCKIDSYVQEKLILLRNNFGSFWCGLDEKNKIKYVRLVREYYENE